MKTIEEIKKAKSKIEADILASLRKFESDSKLLISRVDVEIDRNNWEDEERARKDPKFKLPKIKGVLDVTIHADPKSMDY